MTPTEGQTTACAPKGIANHPAVARVLNGADEGCDLRWFVELKPGWVFNSGRAEGCNTPMMGVDSVRDFTEAKPEFK